MQASPAYPDHPIAGALIAAAAPLKPWIWLTPSFPTHVLAGVHFVPIGPEGQSALDGDPDDQQRRRFGTRSYGDLSDAVVVIGELATAGGVVVLDAGSGAPVSFNREVRRIVDGLRIPDQSLEQFLEVMTVRRADGREISLREFPLAQAMSTGETVRAE